MNFTIETSNGNNNSPFKQLKAQYVAAACGVALAVAAVVATAPWQGSSTEQVAPAASRFIATSSNSPDVKASPLTYLIVDNDAEATRMEGSFASDSHVRTEPVDIRVLVIDTPEKEMAFLRTQQELVLTGQVFDVADARTQNVTPLSRGLDATVVANSAELDAAIMTGVVSTERAAWAPVENTATVRQVSDADVRASLLSTEGAVWGLENNAPVRQVSAADAWASLLSSERSTWTMAEGME